MKLAIADPPYPPYADRSARGNGGWRQSRARYWYTDKASHSGTAYSADHHDEAQDWDKPETHRGLLEKLHAEYDGWAIATSSDGASFYGELPRGGRQMIWVNPKSMSGASRIRSIHELVLLFDPPSRRKMVSGQSVNDVLIEPSQATGFPGSKPPRWTHWVLDALGYDPDADTVDDLFPGSGAVSRAITYYQEGIFA